MYAGALEFKNAIPTAYINQYWRCMYSLTACIVSCYLNQLEKGPQAFSNYSHLNHLITPAVCPAVLYFLIPQSDGIKR